MVRDNIALTTMINDHDGGDYDAEEEDVEDDDVEDDDGTDDLAGVRGLWTLVPAARQEGRRPLREFNCQIFLQPKNMFLGLSII